MREFRLKICLFLFLASLLSARSELSVLTASVTGTILLWPLYRGLMKLCCNAHPRSGSVEKRDSHLVAAGQRLEGPADINRLADL